MQRQLGNLSSLSFPADPGEHAGHTSGNIKMGHRYQKRG